MMQARPLKPPKITVMSTITAKNGFQISELLIAAMNKSSAGFVHRSLIR
jgi:hypothetical protein